MSLRYSRVSRESSLVKIQACLFILLEIWENNSGVNFRNSPFAYTRTCPVRPSPKQWQEVIRGWQSRRLQLRFSFKKGWPSFQNLQSLFQFATSPGESWKLLPTPSGSGWVNCAERTEVIKWKKKILSSFLPFFNGWGTIGKVEMKRTIPD